MLAVTERMGAALGYSRERLIWSAATVLLPPAPAARCGRISRASRRYAPPCASSSSHRSRRQTYGRAAISPDGRNLVFTADSEDTSQLWLRPLGGFTAHPLSGNTGCYGSSSLAASDSRSIGFFADGKLKKIDAAAGTPQTLCNLPSGVRARGGAWSRDGVILFVAADVIHRVPATGGEPIPVRGGEPAPANSPGEARPNTASVRPYFLPDGSHFLHYVKAPQESGIYLASLEGKEGRRLLASDSDGS